MRCDVRLPKPGAQPVAAFVREAQRRRFANRLYMLTVSVRVIVRIQADHQFDGMMVRASRDAHVVDQPLDKE